MVLSFQLEIPSPANPQDSEVVAAQTHPVTQGYYGRGPIDAQDEGMDLQDLAPNESPGGTHLERDFSINKVYASVPVSESSTRLLRLRPRLLNAQQELDGEGTITGFEGVLYKAELDKMPKYLAASYHWGLYHGQSIYLRIFTEDGTQSNASLTLSCYHMLSELHQVAPSIDLWVDAICINQRDTTERSNQVKHIGTIYAKANATVIWLGCHEEIVNAMKALVKTWRWGSDGHFAADETRFKRLTTAVMRHYIFNLLFKQVWRFSGQSFGLIPLLIRLFLRVSHLRGRSKELGELLNASWRTRVWTFQELVLARRPVLMSKGCVVEWSNLVFVLGWLQTSVEKGTMELPCGLAQWQSLAGLWAVVDWHRRYRSGEPITIWNRQGFKSDNTRSPIVRAVHHVCTMFHDAYSTAAEDLQYAWECVTHLSSRLWKDIVHVWKEAKNIVQLVLGTIGCLFMYLFQIIARISCTVYWRLAAALDLIFSLLWYAKGALLFFGSSAVSIWAGFHFHKAPLALIAVCALMILWWYCFRQRSFAQRMQPGSSCKEHKVHKLPFTPPKLEWPSLPRLDDFERQRFVRSRVSWSAHKRRSLRPVSAPFPSKLLVTPPLVVLEQALVEALRDRKATADRDKTFALHSFLNLAEAELPQQDYDLALIDSYRGFFAALLKWDKAMIRLILDAGMASRNDESWSSWVPDWRDNGWRTWLDSDYLRFKNEHESTPSRGSSEPHDFFDGDEQGRLMLRGRWLEECKQCFVLTVGSSAEAAGVVNHWVQTRMEMGITLHPLTAVFVQWLEHLHNDLFGQVPHEQCLEDRINEVLAGSLVSKGKRLPSTKLSYLLSALDKQVDLRDPLRPDYARHEPLLSHVLQHLQKTLVESHGGKSLFTTTKGRFGAGPTEMEPGDRLALVEEIPVPLVLRPAGAGDYKLVGPAFLSGAMKGEDWNTDTELELIKVI